MAVMAPPSLQQLRIKIFADGADLRGIAEMARSPIIQGFTTNPTLMRRAQVVDYERFARAALELVGGRPIAFEVFADELAEMGRQARKIAGWGGNVVVKLPVTNTRRESCVPLIERLAGDGVRLNVTALLTLEQVHAVAAALRDGPAAFVSVFAGRIADTGRDPVPIMRAAVAALRGAPRTELIWASPRELLNVFQADAVGCHVITATSDVLAKLPLVGRDLAEYSLETVRMFHEDGRSAGFEL